MNLFPTAESVFERFAESVIESPRKRRQFTSLLNFFGVTSFAERKRQKMIVLAERGINPFDLHSVPNNFSGIYPELSFSILLEKAIDPVAQRAAKLAVAALNYRQALRDGWLDKETIGGTAIGDDRRRHLFGRVANVKRTGLHWIKQIKHCEGSRHIAVAVNGHYYTLDVIDGGNVPKPPERIVGGIEAILRAAAGERNGPQPYGIITANIAKPSVEVFYADTLDSSIKAIDEAIFLLAIDTTKRPADENQAARDLHINNFYNRDYRKALQLVVLEGGFSGMTCSLFAEIEGVPAVRFASWIDSYARNMPPLTAEREQCDFTKLSFGTIDFGAFPLAKLKRKVARYTCDLPLIKRIDVLGKDAIKQLNCSPDAFFHAAAHLAYYEKFNRIPSVQNLADIRAVRFGSITRYLSTTDELTAFLKNQSKPALIAAFQAHNRTVTAIKSGDYPLHYAFYYLYTRVGIKPLLGIILFKLFVPDIFSKYISPDIWASNIPALPGVHCVGRFGIYFKMARKDCLAGHYLLCSDHIKICFPSNERRFLDSWQFDRALEAAMNKLKQILSQ